MESLEGNLTQDWNLLRLFPSCTIRLAGEETKKENICADNIHLVSQTHKKKRYNAQDLCGERTSQLSSAILSDNYKGKTL